MHKLDETIKEFMSFSAKELEAEAVESITDEIVYGFSIMKDGKRVDPTEWLNLNRY